MGNIWGRKTSSNVVLEGDEDGASGSIEMKGSEPSISATISSRSLSSWPLCLEDRACNLSAQSYKRDLAPRAVGVVQQEEAGDQAGPSSSSAFHAARGLADGHTLLRLDSDRVSGAGPSCHQDYHEVHLTLSIPCTHASEPSKETLQHEALAKDLQRQAAMKALDAKTQECESLLRVVKELTTSRNKLTAMRSIQGERFADLQHDFLRVSRVADLSRALSRENIAKATHLSGCLNNVEEELARQRLTAQQFQEQCLRLKIENRNLKDKLNLMKRVDVVAFRRESACLIEFQQLHLKETY